MSTAKGDFVNDRNSVPQWSLLGDGSFKPAGTTIKQAARLSGQATVKNFDFATDIASVVSTFRGTPTISGQANLDDVILKGNAGSGTLGGTVAADMQHVFPNGPDKDQFSTAVTGQLQVIDTNGAPGELLTFGLFADDNAAFRIVGQNFTAAAGDGTTTVGNPEGGADQWLLADFRTGNTNAYGLITLPEGTYNFEGFHLEDGGGAAMEVWVSAGDRLTTRLNSGTFFPLTLDAIAEKPVPANQGLGLVAGPGTGPVAKPGDFDLDGDVDGSDFMVWQRGGSPNPVSSADLALWKANYATAVAATGAVPEPGTLCLGLIVVGAGAGCIRRRG